jgi:hypothetical protein
MERMILQIFGSEDTTAIGAVNVNQCLGTGDLN